MFLLNSRSNWFKLKTKRTRRPMLRGSNFYKNNSTSMKMNLTLHQTKIKMKGIDHHFE